MRLSQMVKTTSHKHIVEWERDFTWGTTKQHEMIEIDRDS